MTEQPQLLRQRVMDSSEPGTIRYELYKLGWEQKQLASADYWFFTHDYKKVGIERKAVQDLLGSIGDRLTRQLENMLDHYQINILLIEGSWQKVSPSQKIISGRGIEYHTWDMVWNYIRRFQDKGITLELTINEGHTVQRLNELYALYQKSYSLSGLSKEFADDRLMALPSGCRGKTGMEVIKQLGSLKTVGNTSVEQLLEIEGIGQKKAQSIYNHFNRGDSNVLHI